MNGRIHGLIGGVINGKVDTLGSLLNPPDGYAFKIPKTGVIELPTNTLDNWSIRRSTGDPLPEMSLVNIDSSKQKKIGSDKAIRLFTGVNAYAENYLRYTFAEVRDLSQYHILFWIRLVDGAGISAYSTITGIRIQLYDVSGTLIINSLLAAYPTEYKGAGWYAFSMIVNTATPIRYVNVGISKTATNSPTFELGKFVFVPKAVKTQVCFMADGGYSSHLQVANLLKQHGMFGTFYVDGAESQQLSVSDLRTMQADGHLIGIYARNFGGDIDVEGRLSILNNAKTYLFENGLTGYRHFIHGITSVMTEELWEAIVPKYADTIGYGMRVIQSQCHKTYLSRYHEFLSTEVATIQGHLTDAINNGARLGILLHDITGDNWTAFNDFVVNTLVPLQQDGTIEVINAKQAFDSIT